MKRGFRTGLTLCSALLVLSGCAGLGSMESLAAVKTDPSLPSIRQVKTVVDRTSVGFEWPAIADGRVRGIDVYRAVAVAGAGEQKFTKIATLDNRYATHYVDTSIRPSQSYLYTFRTFGLFKGSVPGQIVRVTTRPPFPAVGFFKAYLPDPGVVKLLWTPHADPRITEYVVERKLAGDRWKYLATVHGRLSPEYIDMSGVRGRSYSYRVVARSADGFRSLASAPATVTIR